MSSGSTSSRQRKLPCAHFKVSKGSPILIKIKPRVKPYDIKRKIQKTFQRNAEVDAKQIIIEANGSEVVLKGKVRSWAEREEAERGAWRAPGVTKVEDHIVVRNDVKPFQSWPLSQSQWR
jgi:osmotically-inducible protein OsmY